MSFDGRSGLTCSNCSTQFFCGLSLVHSWFFPLEALSGFALKQLIFQFLAQSLSPVDLWRPSPLAWPSTTQEGPRSRAATRTSLGTFCFRLFANVSVGTVSGALLCSLPLVQPLLEQPLFPPCFSIIFLPNFISPHCPPPAMLTKGLKADFGADLWTSSTLFPCVSFWPGAGLLL